MRQAFFMAAQVGGGVGGGDLLLRALSPQQKARGLNPGQCTGVGLLRPGPVQAGAGQFRC